MVRAGGVRPVGCGDADLARGVKPRPRGSVVDVCLRPPRHARRAVLAGAGLGTRTGDDADPVCCSRVRLDRWSARSDSRLPARIGLADRRSRPGRRGSWLHLFPVRQYQELRLGFFPGADPGRNPAPRHDVPRIAGRHARAVRSADHGARCARSHSLSLPVAHDDRCHGPMDRCRAHRSVLPGTPGAQFATPVFQSHRSDILALAP